MTVKAQPTPEELNGGRKRSQREFDVVIRMNLVLVDGGEAHTLGQKCLMRGSKGLNRARSVKPGCIGMLDPW